MIHKIKVVNSTPIRYYLQKREDINLDNTYGFSFDWIHISALDLVDHLKIYDEKLLGMIKKCKITISADLYWKNHTEDEKKNIRLLSNYIDYLFITNEQSKEFNDQLYCFGHTLIYSPAETTIINGNRNFHPNRYYSIIDPIKDDSKLIYIASFIYHRIKEKTIVDCIDTAFKESTLYTLKEESCII